MTICNSVSNILFAVAELTRKSRLLGHTLFQPIWDKLDEHHAVVFIHPTSINMSVLNLPPCHVVMLLTVHHRSPKFIAGNFPQPIVDYPIGTTRTAVDLVLSKTLATHANVKIILSHGGGTLPFLLERILSVLPENCEMAREEV
jgi:6-methylsalicylate decarboxylase